MLPDRARVCATELPDDVWRVRMLLLLSVTATLLLFWVEIDAVADAVAAVVVEEECGWWRCRTWRRLWEPPVVVDEVDGCGRTGRGGTGGGEEDRAGSGERQVGGRVQGPLVLPLLGCREWLGEMGNGRAGAGTEGSARSAWLS